VDRRDIPGTTVCIDWWCVHPPGIGLVLVGAPPGLRACERAMGDHRGTERFPVQETLKTAPAYSFVRNSPVQ
jgi:hypothetical protein